jgi:uracil-DNA glycosylase
MALLKDLLSQLHPSWQAAFKEKLNSSYLKDLSSFLEEEFKGEHKIYPPKPLIFNAFNKTPFNKVKVVILGQDPYHGEGQAHGLSFSVPSGIKIPPSLRNIYKELREDLDITTPDHGNLEGWAKQGVLLLNATLTVREKAPKSHYGKGWELLTDFIIASLAKSEQPIAFLLWGRSAIEKELIIKKEGKPPFTVLKAPHPSPFSAHTGFFSCKHFSKVNKWLIEKGLTPVDWKAS